MQASGTFTVTAFQPSTIESDTTIATALPTGIAIMQKQYTGGVTGRSSTVFVSAFDQDRGFGSYVALESFEGSLNGVAGTFNYIHSAATRGSDRYQEHFTVVPESGTAGLHGITGVGRIAVGADGGHEIVFEYDIPAEKSR
ncbi:DUF3224 domain-containing protein [Microbacterium sp.]|uniref:DUF3224 domain-containing protein n=1 Tax=Microbacterium sp. TaxID=51671 RepID=UPI0028114006|nr:DUF3224 domain-containing protein [Microbacterium sp.]